MLDYMSRLMLWMRGLFGRRLRDSETLCSPCHGDVEPAKHAVLQACGGDECGYSHSLCLCECMYCIQVDALGGEHCL
jgi:hypothetical protein